MTTASLETYPTDTTAFLSPDIQSGFISAEIGGTKPADEALVPVHLVEARRLMVEEGIVPAGIFRDCALFGGSHLAEEQRRYRRATPTATAVVTIVGENLDRHDPKKQLAWDLMQMYVEVTRERAVMVEAARQYYNKEEAGELSEPEASFLLAQLDSAQDKLYPHLDTGIAATALSKIENPHMTSESYLTQEMRSSWKDFLHQKYDPLFDATYEEVDQDEPIIGEHLREMTELFMRHTGLPMAEDIDDKAAWKCVYDAGASGFRVVASEKKVICGDRKDPLTKLGFEKLVMHEIIVHAWRAENGSRLGYDAFQTGLPGYIESEEGLGLLIESLWSGDDPDQLSRDHFRYVAVAYSDGTLDGEMHTEQETHDFIKPKMEKAGFGEDTEELFRHIMRPFRGMPEGCRMRSNATYLTGKLMMMRVLQHMYDQQTPIEAQITMLQAAKIDSTNPRQLQLLAEAKATQHKLAAEEARA